MVSGCMVRKRETEENDDKTTAEIVETIAEEREYSSHKDQLLDSGPSEERRNNLQQSLMTAFEKAIVYHSVPFIAFGELDAAELAAAFVHFPSIVKPTMSCVNVAQRAIKRDLGFDFDTYGNTITEQQALLLAGYVKPFLPPMIAVPALMELDRYFWTDKEMRARKGNWERIITDAINAISDKAFRKRKFVCDSQEFEIDAAYPSDLGEIEIAIDVKRIESQRDIHKRADEIINKAAKFKEGLPNWKLLRRGLFPFSQSAPKRSKSVAE